MINLIYAFLARRLDYCNSVLAGLPLSTATPLQRVQNAAASLLLNHRKSDHITDKLKEHHWLFITFMIQNKLCIHIRGLLNISLHCDNDTKSFKCNLKITHLFITAFNLSLFYLNRFCLGIAIYFMCKQHFYSHFIVNGGIEM